MGKYRLLKCHACGIFVSRTYKRCPHCGHDREEELRQKEKDLKKVRRKQGLCENCGRGEFREQKELISYISDASDAPYKSRINFFCTKCGFENKYMLKSFDGKVFDNYDKESSKNYIAKNGNYKGSKNKMTKYADMTPLELEKLAVQGDNEAEYQLAMRHYETALRYYKDSDVQNAINRLNRIISNDNHPRRVSAIRFLAQMYAANGTPYTNKSEAIRLFEIIKNVPTAVLARLGLGLLYSEKGRIDEGLALIESAVNQLISEDGNDDYLKQIECYKIGVAYEGAQCFSLAVKYYNKAINRCDTSYESDRALIQNAKAGIADCEKDISIGLEDQGKYRLDKDPIQAWEPMYSYEELMEKLDAIKYRESYCQTSTECMSIADDYESLAELFESLPNNAQAGGYARFCKNQKMAFYSKYQTLLDIETERDKAIAYNDLVNRYNSLSVRTGNTAEELSKIAYEYSQLASSFYSMQPYLWARDYASMCEQGNRMSNDCIAQIIRQNEMRRKTQLAVGTMLQLCVLGAYFFIMYGTNIIRDGIKRWEDTENLIEVLTGFFPLTLCALALGVISLSILSKIKKRRFDFGFCFVLIATVVHSLFFLKTANFGYYYETSEIIIVSLVIGLIAAIPGLILTLIRGNKK